VLAVLLFGSPSKLTSLMRRTLCDRVNEVLFRPSPISTFQNITADHVHLAGSRISHYRAN